MTDYEKRDCLNMAKRFAELYYNSGLVGISTDVKRNPRLHLTVNAFNELYKDSEFHFREHGDDYEVYTEDDGVSVFALLTKEEMLGGVNE